MDDHDVLVVGAGGAGLRAAIAAHERGADVALVSKLHPVRSHTGSAEGGVNAALRSDDSVDRHAMATIAEGDGIADAPAVERLVETIPHELVRLERWGVPFSRDEDGRIAQRSFDGLAFPRTAYADEEIGLQILHTLYQQVCRRGIRVYDEYYVTRLVVSGDEQPADRRCHGVVAMDVRSGEIRGLRARDGVVLATGGAGQLFERTTNATASTGDGIAMAYRAGVPLSDMEFAKFHPTTLRSTGVLINNAVGSAGGRLFNANGERFLFERGYAPTAGGRAHDDRIARAIDTEINAGRGVDDECVLLDVRHLGADRLTGRLAPVRHFARDFEGVDALTELLPVRIGQHFLCGGIETNEHGRTCIDGLYAAGECACVSVHGAGWIGGNSLAEVLVYGARAGLAAAGADLPPARIPVGPSADQERTDETPPELAVGGGHGPDPVADGGSPSSGVGASSGSRSGTALVERAVERERERIDRLLEADGTVEPDALRRRIQEVMHAHVTVSRTRDGLEQALESIDDVRERYKDVTPGDASRTFNTALVATLETRNLIDLAAVVAASALARPESRGTHYRVDHPNQDDAWRAHTLVSHGAGDPELWTRPPVDESELGAAERSDPTDSRRID